MVAFTLDEICGESDGQSKVFIKREFYSYILFIPFLFAHAMASGKTLERFQLPRLLQICVFKCVLECVRVWMLVWCLCLPAVI